MVQQVTKGIKISVQSRYEGVLDQGSRKMFAFSYKITIENNSPDTVQLLSRFWEINDALNSVQTVSGQGVIGIKPVLEPGESHSYSSGCMLLSPIGLMKGYYTMINFNSRKAFKVTIPAFRLTGTFALN